MDQTSEKGPADEEIWERGLDQVHRIDSTSLLLLLLLSHFSRVRLCVDPIDGSPPGSPIPGILQARTLEWVAIAFSATSLHLQGNEHVF